MRRPTNPTQAIYVISVAAELAGVHPQTLRVYERKGLLTPQRTAGNTRRYSQRDIERLRRIQELSREGVNLAGALRVLELEERLLILESQLEDAVQDSQRAEGRLTELLQARDSLSLVPAREVRRIRRAMRSDAIERAGRRRIFSAPAAVDETRTTQPTQQG